MLYKRQKFTKELFQNPTNEYRGAPFWSWNCKLTKEEADAILADLKMMGMGGSHLHCRTGMDIPFQRNLWNWSGTRMKRQISWGCSPGFMTKIAFLPEQQAERLRKTGIIVRDICFFHRKLWRKIHRLNFWKDMRFFWKKAF